MTNLTGRPSRGTVSRRTLLTGLTGCACCGGLLSPIGVAYGQKGIPKGGCGVPVPDIPSYTPKVLAPDKLEGPALGFRNAFKGGASANIADARTKAVKRLADTFGVIPPFDFYDDSGAPNARAFRPTADFPQGKVIFGFQLYNELMTKDPTGASVLAVLAHEYGHITFFLSGQEQLILGGRKTVKRSELHADYLAGYYLGVRKRESPKVSLWKAGRLIWSIGDTAFDNEDHHGTPDERRLSAEAGFKLGFDQAPQFQTAFASATTYILDTYADDPL